MDLEQQLHRIADRYREQGYQVVIRPGADDLPPFAKDFHVEVLAMRPDGNVLASVKATAREFETDRELSRYADIIGNHPSWRYDIFAVSRSEPPPPAFPREATDLTEAQIAEALEAAEQLDQQGYKSQSVIAAWAAAESAMRHRIRALGGKATWGANPQAMLNELLSSGALSSGDYRRFLELSQLRNIIVHGFAIPEIDPDAVPFLANATRQLLADAEAMEQAS